MENITYLIISVIALSLGSVLGYLARQTIARKQAGSIEAKLDKLVTKAKTQAKETLIKAKDKAVKILEDAKKEEKARLSQIAWAERRLERREDSLDRRVEEVEKNYQSLKEKVIKVKNIKQDLEGMRKKVKEDLKKVAGLSEEEAKKELFVQIEASHKKELLKRIEKLEREGKEEIEKRSRDMMILAMQRFATSQAAEVTTSTVSLPSDDLKGRIIGREGRNIRTLERLTGVEIVIDDTPEAITISAFNPIRRQIAKIALERLIADGRIQPARIEETVAKAQEEIGAKIKEAGEAAVYDVGVVGLDPSLIRLLGRLRFRTSFGQNVLLHSLEVAHLASALASEIGADATLAKKAGLLHDIGKAVDQEVQGSHTKIGINILRKFGVSEEVIKAMQSHHEEFPFESTEAVIIQVADAISGARPGARKDTLENYLRRLEDLEKVASSFEEVEKAYAVQAGREVRVFVTPERVDDLGAIKLARKIADRIEETLKYPGEIKVHVIRETRAVEYAR